MSAFALAGALVLASFARGGTVASVPADVVAPLSISSLAPLYDRACAVLPAGPRGDGSRAQLAAYLDAGDYSRVETYFRSRLLPAYAQSQPLAARALARVAPNSARFREGTELGRVTAAFDALRRPDSRPVQELNAQLRGIGQIEEPAQMSAALDRLFDGLRRRSETGEISELYARFVLGEASKPLEAAPLDRARKKGFYARLGDEMGRYSPEPPRLE